MAFNWQTFRTRTLTATVFVAVMLAGLLINQWTFFILFSIIHFGCWWEYLKLIEKIFKIIIDASTKWIFMVSGFLLFLVIGFYIQPSYFEFRLIPSNFEWALYLFVLLCIVVILFVNKKLPAAAKWILSAGFVYISFSLGLMISFERKTSFHVHDSVFVLVGNFFPIAIIASLWVNDTMAYIVGSLIGKTQMSAISPKKTWEGTIGGIILSVAVIFILSNLIFYSAAMNFSLVILAIIASITGTFGDFIESKLKRMAGVKDSGRIMPGHGGFLDRFDSLLFATPFVWLFVYLTAQP